MNGLGGGVCVPGDMKGPLQVDGRECKVISPSVGANFLPCSSVCARHEETGLCVGAGRAYV